MDVTNIVPKVAVMSLTSFSMTFANKKDSISLPMLQHFLESTTSLDKPFFDVRKRHFDSDRAAADHNGC